MLTGQVADRFANEQPVACSLYALTGSRAFSPPQAISSFCCAAGGDKLPYFESRPKLLWKAINPHGVPAQLLGTQK
jgi:hypothetical protein